MRNRLIAVGNFVRDFALDARYRASVPIRLKFVLMGRPKYLLQPFVDTEENRYPALFQYVRDAIGDGPDRHLLSFGCSTGEEVFALRRYFQAAQIKGIDINRRNIAICNKRTMPGIVFETNGSAAAEPSHFYDAIFCMAVFTHGKISRPQVQSCERYIRFGDFEFVTNDLARCLKPSGLLVIVQNSFRFRDVGAFGSFEVALKTRLPRPPPIFDRHNCRLPNPAYTEAVFRKIQRTVLEPPERDGMPSFATAAGGVLD